MSDCLLLIDVQNGFLSDETSPMLGRLEELCRSGRFDFIVSTRFVNTPDSPYVRRMGWEKLMDSPETDLVGFVEELSDRVFVKHVYTAVSGEFLAYVDSNGIDRVYIAGFDTDCCVLKTACDLFEQGRDFVVLLDYTASNGGKESYDAAIRVMERQLGEGSLKRGIPLRGSE